MDGCAKKYLAAYANYYLRYLEEYAKEGIRIRALTSQNEPETDQLGQMPACFWHPEMEMSFLKDHLAPLLESHGLGDTQLWILDHNYVHWRRAKWMLDDAAFKKLVKGVAFHTYEGEAREMSKLHAAHPDANLYVTELGGGFDWPMPRYGNLFIDMLKNWSRCICSWNIVLDERTNPHLGPFIPADGGLAGGMMQLNSKTSELICSSSYYALGHFSRFVRRDAWRIGCDCDLGEINCVALVNPDGQNVVILANPGASTEASLLVQGRCARSTSRPDRFAH